MHSERAIRRVLDLATRMPRARPEHLNKRARGHADQLARLVRSPNVVGVGMSEKVAGGGRTGVLSLTFYVQNKLPLRRLRGDLAIPSTLPAAISGAVAIPTDVVALGWLQPDRIPLIARHVIQPSFSIGTIRQTGTLGAIVSKGRGRDVCVLSNSHVLANSGKGRIGDTIVYPAPADGGRPRNDGVAKLAKFSKFKIGRVFRKNLDCAIAAVAKSRVKDLVPEIKSLGYTKGWTTPKRNMKIVKVGRSSGKTTGVVKDVHFRFIMHYDGVGDVGFIDQVLCTRYSEPGDSGALVLERGSDKAVGLHFASAEGGSVFCPIGSVLKGLQIGLVGRPIKLH